jgi:hypothetical protein
MPQQMAGRKETEAHAVPLPLKPVWQLRRITLGRDKLGLLPLTGIGCAKLSNSLSVAMNLLASSFSFLSCLHRPSLRS